jgi:hypothetical protein
LCVGSWEQPVVVDLEARSRGKHIPTLQADHKLPARGARLSVAAEA